MEEHRRRFGARVRSLRKKAGLTQERLGELSGVDHKYLSRVERAVVNPSVDTLFKLADGLGVAPAELVTFEDRPTPEEARRLLRRELEELVEQGDDEKLQQVAVILRVVLG